MNSYNTSTSDGDGSNPPTNQPAGLVLAIDGSEARLLRRQGFKCVTSAKARGFVMSMLERRAPERAIEAIRRFAGVSEADSPDTWPIWQQAEVRHLEGAAEVRQALASLPVIPTPLKDPAEPYLLTPAQVWGCSGTTILVAADTFELVQVADTYGGYRPYRPHGRMDEPFTPEAGRVCLITGHELRLLRLEGVKDAEIVLCYPLEKMTGTEVTPRLYWPTPIRALCGENPGLTVAVAPGKVNPRPGYPFFLGLTRGLAYESLTETNSAGPAALAYCIQTNREPETVRLNVVVWEGGDDPRKLACYGGLSIFLNKGGRRKVQLRSLGLVRSGTVAGQPVYDLGHNYNTLLNWAVRRTFERPEYSMRNRNSRRVRYSETPSPEYRRGTSIISYSPHGIRVTPPNTRQAASQLRSLVIAIGGDSGVTTVPLRTLQDGQECYFNGRPRIGEGGRVVLDPKRWKIRAMAFDPADKPGLLGHLKGETHVILAGTDEKGAVFAVVRVANGTEDQQREAVERWAQGVGRCFSHASGCPSLIPASLKVDALTVLGALSHTNWKAAALETGGFERYQQGGDYAKPLEIKRRAPASASERARAYADTVQGLDVPGGRNNTLAGAMLNVGTKFGIEALKAVMPSLLARSTLPEKEKQKLVAKKLAELERKNHK